MNPSKRFKLPESLVRGNLYLRDEVALARDERDAAEVEVRRLERELLAERQAHDHTRHRLRITDHNLAVLQGRAVAEGVRPGADQRLEEASYALAAACRRLTTWEGWQPFLEREGFCWGPELLAWTLRAYGEPAYHTVTLLGLRLAQALLILGVAHKIPEARTVLAAYDEVTAQRLAEQARGEDLIGGDQ